MHLDISIPKYSNKFSDFFNKKTCVEQKTDGIKLTVLKTENDIIFAYKGNVLYKEEYNFANNKNISKHSIGASQFKLAIEHFLNEDLSCIPANTEFFIEYLMKKPTLATSYNTYHNMILLAYSHNVEYDKEMLKYGKLLITNNSFNQTYLMDYASILNIDTPKVLFYDIPSNHYENIESFFDDMLSIKSHYGGVEEGVVVYFDSNRFKVQNDHQHDKEHRQNIKSLYKENNINEENLYWLNVKTYSSNILNYIDNSKPLNECLKSLSDVLSDYPIHIKHTKKNELNIKDDIQLTTKTMIIKRLVGNNNAAVVGKFRVLTLDGHIKMIDEALSTHDKVVVFIVSNKDNVSTKYFREQMIKDVYDNKVDIIHVNSANIVNLLRKSNININTIFCGTDRYDEYSKQIERTSGVSIKCIDRSENDISASKVLNNINDVSFFTANTPKQIHKYYNNFK